MMRRFAQRLQAQMQAELEEEDRLVRQREEEANIVSWDNVQAMIDADYQMAQQMQAEEQEKLSIKEKSKLFVQLLEARKKHFAAIRAKEKRNKPPTKAQKRNTMSTYLKNMAGYKHNQLKNKSFDDIQKLFDKAMKRVNTFVDKDIELVEGSKVRVEAEIAQESSSKRAGTKLEQESIKKPKVDEDNEIAELQRLIEIIRADGSLKMYLVFSHMLKSFDREDLETLWKLVKAKHGSTRPEEGYERVLWGDLKTMMQHMHIHMLVEKRYPLTPATITDMLNKKLQCDHFSEMGRIVGIKRLHDDLEVTVAKVCVTAAKLNTASVKLVLLVKIEENILINAANTKVTTAQRSYGLLIELSTVKREWIKTEERIKIDWRSRLLT
ncbi:hypothetical protein Tco_0741962 [Tanacetum coccineum]